MTAITGAAGAVVTALPVGVASASSEGALAPPAFTARTWNVYSVCGASPVTVWPVVAELPPGTSVQSP